MGIRALKDIMKEVIRKYDREPRGWSVFADGRGNVLVVGPGVGYKLKVVSVDPKHYVGVGTEMKEFRRVEGLLGRFSSYGLRPLPKEITKMLLRGNIRGEAVRRLVEREPVPSWKLRDANGILSGPIISHPDLSVVSSSQRRLEERLTLEANGLFRKLYPRRASIYG